MKASKIKQRIFLVGCPRSGTTLLKSFIAGHSKVASFPESKLFQRLNHSNVVWNKLGIASATARPNFNQFFHDVGRVDMIKNLSSNAIFARQYAQAFVKSLDVLTIEEDKSCWLEKTPAHLHYISYVEKLIPRSKFIHIIRDGKNVVSSLYDVSHKYPEVWLEPWNIDKCIQSMDKRHTN